MIVWKRGAVLLLLATCASLTMEMFSNRRSRCTCHWSQLHVCRRLVHITFLPVLACDHWNVLFEINVSVTGVGWPLWTHRISREYFRHISWLLSLISCTPGHCSSSHSFFWGSSFTFLPYYSFLMRSWSSSIHLAGRCLDYTVSLVNRRSSSLVMHSFWRFMYLPNNRVRPYGLTIIFKSDVYNLPCCRRCRHYSLTFIWYWYRLVFIVFVTLILSMVVGSSILSNFSLLLSSFV